MQEELQSIAAMAAPGELGNLTLAAEDARAEWGWTRLEQAGQDLRYALRTLRKSPAFTATTVLSLAIGIGANTALFTLINTVMWKLLPVHDPEHLLVLVHRGPTSVSNGFTYQQYDVDPRQHGRARPHRVLRCAAECQHRRQDRADDPGPARDWWLLPGARCATRPRTAAWT